MNKEIIGCQECGNNIPIKIEDFESNLIKEADEIIEKLSGGGVSNEYTKGYLDALVFIRNSILQRNK